MQSPLNSYLRQQPKPLAHDNLPQTCQQVIVNDDIRFYTLLLHFFTHSENLYGVLGIGKSCRPELVTRYSTTGCSSLKTVIGNEGPWFIPNCRRARIWSRLCCNLLGALTSYMGVQNRVCQQLVELTHGKTQAALQCTQTGMTIKQLP